MTLRKFLAAFALSAVFFPIAAVQASEMIADGAFDKGGDRIWASGGVSLSREDGKLCASVPAGGEPWDRLMGVNDLNFIPDTVYHLSARLESSVPRSIPVFVQRNEDPWTAQASFTVEAEVAMKPFSADFRATEDKAAQVIFHLGGAASPWRLCLDMLSVREASADEGAQIETTPAPAAKSGIAVDLTPRVNQAGYFADGPKRATVVSDDQAPLPFRLLDASGLVAREGMTEPMGIDPTVEAGTQVADFSSFQTIGEGYRLVVGGKESPPFSIGRDVYGRLRIDALSWFYPQRSGMEIRAEIAGEGYARPAGHIGLRPNDGDTSVPCLSGEAAARLFGDWSCDYQLDVSGGWYDAGDHGKYVVNGGIAVAQLLGTFERGVTFGGGASPVLSDSLSRIPETGNGVPDLLDEARWQLEFLMRMMVPDGQPLAGMVHHKIHDTEWTGLPMLPHLDPKLRVLHRPSTAATLNLAAAAAQGARLFASYDAAFAQRLLEAAKKAWLAAAANPVLYAPQSDGGQGGGDYADDDITDETYWAAAELYITTGEAPYLVALKASPHWAGPVFSAVGAFDWRSTAGLGRLDLALYSRTLAEDDRAMIRDSVISAAREFQALQGREPFGQIYRPGNSRFDWGSNQLILQNMIVLSAAFDLTGQRSFLNAVRGSMDYLLGRNLMNLSYITGYGSVWAQNQHSRWYANQVDDSLPNPPVGSLAGGPNSALVDDVAKEKLQGCVPQACYVDDIMSWGTNEITINWNAPLVYIASFLADAR
ncbi:glycoside hydrolase family 9 protein [Pararhizobium antarcticum]